jgi:diguanylate cyclase (GGDEF)-like protein
MDYRHFERLVLALGAGALLSVTLIAPGQLMWQELLAQAMFLFVLAGAVHWGRRGGFVAAAIASLVYIVIRLPIIAENPEVSANVAAMLLSRIAGYGIVGIIGGEACARMKYVMASMSGDATIDAMSRVYNQRHAVKILTAAHGRHTRYGEPFSVVMVSLSPSLTVNLRASRARHVIRSAANHIRSDVRMVDEVARLDDGRFFILLPHTPRTGAEIVTRRLASGLQGLLGARSESIAATCLGADEDGPAIEALKRSMGGADQSTSYNDDGSSTVKPAERNASAAPSASILKMSTASPPEGSTKQ